jgi:uncharacterized protein (DUF427 family)
MTTRQTLIPDAAHPIDISPTSGRVTVRRNGEVIAVSDRALTLREAAYPAVQYIPIYDVNQALLEPSRHTTYCPYKGDANYYSIVIDEDRAENAVWEYHVPHSAVDTIARHIAFYPDQVEIEVA